MAREYDLKLSREYSISRHRYRELKEFCLQYEEKKSELQQIYTSSAVAPEVAVMGGQSGNSTESKALRALKLKAEIELIEKCIEGAVGADIGLADALKKNITLGAGFDSLGRVPCSAKTFYSKRRKFFFLLNIEKN